MKQPFKSTVSQFLSDLNRASIPRGWGVRLWQTLPFESRWKSPWNFIFYSYSCHSPHLMAHALFTHRNASGIQSGKVRGRASFRAGNLRSRLRDLQSLLERFEWRFDGGEIRPGVGVFRPAVSHASDDVTRALFDVRVRSKQWPASGCKLANDIWNKRWIVTTVCLCFEPYMSLGIRAEHIYELCAPFGSKGPAPHGGCREHTSWRIIAKLNTSLFAVMACEPRRKISGALHNIPETKDWRVTTVAVFLHP